MTKTEFIMAYNIGHRDGKAGDYCPNEYDDLQMIDAERTGHWIPVSERLPENRNQEVLISLEWGIDIGRYSDGEWHSEWINHYDDGNVLAWMPLPKPYEPQESEKISERNMKMWEDIFKAESEDKE